MMAGVMAGSLAWVEAHGPGRGVAIDPDDIGGVVTSAKGPEAGVWVVAETTDLPTKFAKIVVTDDRGRGPDVREDHAPPLGGDGPADRGRRRVPVVQ